MVSLALPSSLFAAEYGRAPSRRLNRSGSSSWLEIRHDGTILARTGRTEIGTGMSAYYPQMIAEEL